MITEIRKHIAMAEVYVELLGVAFSIFSQPCPGKVDELPSS
jgi:hypothetical protein